MLRKLIKVTETRVASGRVGFTTLSLSRSPPSFFKILIGKVDHVIKSKFKPGHVCTCLWNT